MKGHRHHIMMMRRTPPGGASSGLSGGAAFADEVERLVNVISKPEDYKIPVWFLNRIHDPKDGKPPCM
eukprot:gene3216-17569_t